MKNKIILGIKSFLIACAVVIPIQSVDMVPVSDEPPAVKFLFFIQQMFRGRQEAFLLLFLCLIVVLHRWNRAFPDKRHRNCIAVASACFGILMTTSASFASSGGLAPVFENGFCIFRAVLKAGGYMLLLLESSRIVLTSGLGQKMRNRDSQMKGRIFQGRYRWLLLSGILFLCWIPYFILCYPGNMTLDAQDELAQVFQQKGDSWTYYTMVHENENDNAINNHQPVAYTCMMGGMALLGKKMGDINIGIAMAAILQMLAAVAVITYLLCFLHRKKVPLPYLYGCLIFFALFPVFPMYAVTITKDMPFAVVMLWMLLELYQVIQAGRNQEPAILHSVLYVVSAVFFCLLRNNGSYILILLLPFLFFLLKKKTKWKVLLLTAIPIVFYFVCFLRVILPLADIAGGSKREMLCVPFQQTARYVSEWGDDGLSEEDIQALDKILNFQGDVSVLAERYDPVYADPVKGWFNKWSTSEDLANYLRVWAKMVVRHPGTAVAATLHNNFLLTSSSGCGKIVYVNSIEKYKDSNIQWYGVSENSYGREMREALEKSLEYMSRLPGVGLLFSIGVYDWLIVFALMVLIARRQYDSLSAGLVLLMCIATSVLGPVIYMRYALAWIMGLPFLLAVLLMERKRK